MKENIGGIIMTEVTNTKPNYNDPEYNHEYNANRKQYENQYGPTSYMPPHYNDRGYTDSFYYDDEESGASSFLLGAIVGGVIGAAAALFLAPKTGKEMREDFSTQASNIKEKSIEISAVAKDKATEYTTVAKDKTAGFTAVAKDKTAEFTAVAKDKTADLTSAAKEKTSAFTTVAKEKTGEVTKSLQKQSGQLVDKVKSMTSKNAAPSEEKEEPSQVDASNNEAEETEEVTVVAEAVKEAIQEKATTK